MTRLPQMAGVTTLRTNYPQVIKMLLNGPVLLAQRSKAIAVMCTPEQWNAQADEIARLRRIVEGDKHFAEMRSGKYLTQEELDRELAAT